MVKSQEIYRAGTGCFVSSKNLLPCRTISIICKTGDIDRRPLVFSDMGVVDVANSLVQLIDGLV
jgi:hypothetical protein